MGSSFSLPYSKSDSIDPIKSGLWEISSGVHDNTRQNVSIFHFEADSQNSAKMSLALNFLENIKSLRHPYILQYIESFTNDCSVVIVTEPVRALNLKVKLDFNVEMLSLGISQICEAIEFLNNKCRKFHCNLQEESVFLSKSGDWKLAGFEFTFSNTKPISKEVADHLKWKFINTPLKNVSHKIARQNMNPLSLDVWNVAAFTCECFGTEPHSLKNFDSHSLRKRLPQDLSTPLRKLLQSDHNKLEQAIKIFRNSPFFDTPFSRRIQFIASINLKTKPQKERFLKSLLRDLDAFPRDIKCFKVLPVLTELLFQDFQSNGDILDIIFRIADLLTPKDYQQMVSPIVVKLFQMKARLARLNVLKHFKRIAARVDRNPLQTQIFPLFLQGFLDSLPVVREATADKSVHIAPKLAPGQFQRLFLCLHKLQRDVEPPIRYCAIAKISVLAELVPADCRDRSVLNACKTALRDPSIPSSCGGLACVYANVGLFNIKFLSGSILQSVGPFSVHENKKVRTLALDCLERIVERLKSSESGAEVNDAVEKEYLESISRYVKTFFSESRSRLETKDSKKKMESAGGRKLRLKTLGENGDLLDLRTNSIEILAKGAENDFGVRFGQKGRLEGVESVDLIDQSLDELQLSERETFDRRESVEGSERRGSKGAEEFDFDFFE